MQRRQTYLCTVLSWFPLVAFVVFYIAYIVPFGLDNNDSGFILGLAFQFFKGSVFYDQILYVRPPVTPILHSLFFHKPFTSAPVFFDRIFFALQIATYSYLSTKIMARKLRWSAAYTNIIASLIFLFSAHNFPPTAWHTTDGIFFAVISYYLCIISFENRSYLLLFSAIFAVLSAGSKQPFYLIPILIGIIVFSSKKKELIVIYCTSLLFSAILFVHIVTKSIPMHTFTNAISSQTTLTDLWEAGLNCYVNDLLVHKSLTFSMASVFASSFYKRKYAESFFLVAMLFATYYFLFTLFNFYSNARAWASPNNYIDSIFVLSTFLCIINSVLLKVEIWPLLLVLHAIAWCSSISWGYQTMALYSAPPILTFAVLIRDYLFKYKFLKYALLITIPMSFTTFLKSHNYFYSIEGTVARDELTEDMGQVSSELSYIRGSKEQLDLYRTLKSVLSQFDSKEEYVVLPNLPLAHILMNHINPIGIDWPLNAEVGTQAENLRERLNAKVTYAVVYTHASPKAETPGKFGSTTTTYVKENWIKIFECKHFDVYNNPTKKSSKKMMCNQ